MNKKPAWLLALLLSGCAAFHALEKAAWDADGDCSVVCDYEMNGLSAAATLSPTACQCRPVAAAVFNKGRPIPLDSEESILLCSPDCKSHAEAILLRHPWRRPGAF